MENTLQHANLFFEKLPDTARKYRVLVWFTFIILCVVICAGIPKVHIDMTMEAYFQKDDPTKLAYDRFRAEFGSDEVLFLTYKARDGDVLSEPSLKALHALHSELSDYRLNLQPGVRSELDHITDVTSLINASFMEAREGELLSRPFIGDQLPTTEQQREQTRQKALSHPDFKEQYLSKDSLFGSIIIETDLGALPEDNENDSKDLLVENNELDDLSDDDELWGEDEIALDMESTWSEENAELATQKHTRFHQANIEQYAALMRAIQSIIEKPEYSEFLEFHPVGTTAVMAFFNDIILQQFTFVLLGSLLLILAVLWLLFHSFSAVLWSTTIVVVSFLLTLGLVGWSGAIMTMMINIIVFLIIAVGIADAIHILSGYLFFRESNQDHETALRSVFKKSGLACFLTSLTTAVGLAALTLTPIVPVKNFGIFAAIGVFIAFLITVFILPLMLDLWAPVGKNKKIESQDKPHRLQLLLQKIEHIGYTHPKSIVATFTIIAATLILGISQIRVDSNIMEILPKNSSVRQSVAIVDDNMAGSTVMDIIFSTGSTDAFKDPRLLNRMEALQHYVEKQYDLIGKTYSLVNVSKDSYKSLNSDDSEFYKIPQEQQMLAQTLFMFNNANPKDRRQLVSDDYSTARMTITLKSAGSYIYIPMIDDIQLKINDLFNDMKPTYPQLEIRVTGGMSLMTKIVNYISWSQIKSFGLALSVISILLLVVFSSVRIGFIALLPNLMPIIFAFGSMGYFGISLDTDTLLVVPIIIGIAVDDTIHFLTHYRAGVLQTGNIKEAIQQTIREAGQAITFTSIVLSLGFLIFLFSSHVSLRNFGILSSLSIMVALITDLLLLPALCVLFNAKFRKSNKSLRNDTTIPAA